MRAARPKPPTDLHRICSNSLRLSGACKASSHATPSHGATTLVRKCREWYANASHMIFETYVLCLLPIVVSQGQLQATGTLLHPRTAGMTSVNIDIIDNSSTYFAVYRD